jgi:hypothetical protein
MLAGGRQGHGMVRKRSQSRMVSKCCCMSSPDQVEQSRKHYALVAVWLCSMLDVDNAVDIAIGV